MKGAPDRVRTLWLCGALHAFTHLYHVALLPLYLLIQRDLHLTSVAQATLLVTVMMISYFLPSYSMGVLADRVSRKKLLGVGLLINAVGFIGLAYAPNYAWAIACVICAGFGGSLYHPAATALIARLFPVGAGKAFGLVAIGAGAGFFIGPLYSGWRAAATGNWRNPVFDLGVSGVAAAVLFLWLAEEQPVPVDHHRRVPQKLFPRPSLWLWFIGASLAFSLRDFAGSSMGTLGSLFLQQAQGFSSTQTGFALSCIFLAAMISNPLFGHLSDGGRIRWTSLVLTVASGMIFLFPRVPKPALFLVLLAYGFFFIASYPITEAALMESVPDAVRGRIFGFFIMISGLVGNLAHWVIGTWVKALGPAADSARSYYPIYNLLAVLVLLSLTGLACLQALRRREEHLGPMHSTELGAPASAEPI